MESCDNGSRVVLKTIGPQGLQGSSPWLSTIVCSSKKKGSRITQTLNNIDDVIAFG